MQVNQLKITLWSITIVMLALIGLEATVYYDPLLFPTFILDKTFKIGPYIRALFVMLYMVCFVLPNTSLQAELERKKQKSFFNVEKGAFYILSGTFLLGCILLFKAAIFPYSYVVEMIGCAIILVTTPFVVNGLRGDQTKYKVATDKKKIDNSDSFSLQGANGTWINIPNPARGVLIVGSNGSGKTASAAEQIIAQGAYKNYTGVIFDFKFPNLTEYAYNHYRRSECKVDLVVVNFVELDKSHRINPLLPELLHFQAYAYEFAAAFYCTLNRDAIRKKDFWDTSAISILAGVIWYMKIHYPAYCTLPHILNMILGHDVYQLIGLLETNYQTKTIVASVSTAIRTKAEPQLAGQYGTLQNAIGRINTQEIAWVLSGNDFDINLNDPKNPKLLCIGTKQDIIEALSPVVSLIITASIKQLNNPDKLHSMVLLDEGPQCYIPNLSDLPATGRSNKIATIYMAQDISQMVKANGKEEAYAIISNLNTQMFGKNPNIETGEYVSKLFGKEEMLQRNESQNRSNPNAMDVKSGSHSQGVSFSIQDKALFKPHELNRMESGEFVGITAETVEPVFHTRVKLQTYNFPGEQDNKLPVFSTDVDANLNFERIRLECNAIIQGLIEPENESQLIASSLRSANMG